MTDVLSVAEYKTLVAKQMTETQLQAKIIRLATSLGYICYHTHDSRKSRKGFPDLCMAGERLVFAELKDMAYKATPEQQKWLAALGRLEEKSGGLVVARLWRPSDYISDEIEEVLRG